MKRYFVLVAKTKDGSSSTIDDVIHISAEASLEDEVNIEVDVQPQVTSNEVDLENLPSDPGLRPAISSYPPNQIEQVRRAYLLKGLCQPRNHDFPQRIMGNRKRKFVPSWFDEGKTWLEYSIANDAIYCLHCHIISSGSRQSKHEDFVSEGFNNWRKKERLNCHVGDHNNDHNKCRLACEDLMNQAQHIELSLSKASRKSKSNYHCRLNASIVCLRYLLMQGLAFRGHDPRDSFVVFDTEKLLCLAKFYPSDFTEVALYQLESQLENFIRDVRADERFSGLSGLGGLAEKLVSTRKHDVFHLVYLLVKLSLTLPVATATVERAFSAMKIIKNALRNRLGDKLLNDCLVPYIENDVFVDVTNEAIMHRFQNMKKGEKHYELMCMTLNF